jgi:hypothetical protein
MHLTRREEECPQLGHFQFGKSLGRVLKSRRSNIERLGAYWGHLDSKEKAGNI